MLKTRSTPPKTSPAAKRMRLTLATMRLGLREKTLSYLTVFGVSRSLLLEGCQPGVGVGGPQSVKVAFFVNLFNGRGPFVKRLAKISQRTIV
jgi:hypothetical protein